MARLGNNGDVSITIGTAYDGKGVEQAKKDMESLSLKMRAEFEKASSPLDKMRQGIEAVKGAWAEWLAVYGAVRFLADVSQEALQAEVAFSKLRTQIEMTGASWRSVSKEVEEATMSTARYARVQQEEVADSMRQLVWATGDYQKAIENLNLVQDLAYQTNMSSAEATRMVGMALTGNLEALGRIKPEFRNLDEILGAHRTTADEVAYFYAVMNEKVVGATRAMTEHEKMVRDLNLAYSDTRQWLGGIINDMSMMSYEMLSFNGIKNSHREATRAIQEFYNALRYGEQAARAMAVDGEHPWSAYIEETRKSAKEIAAETRARSEQVEKQKKADELNKTLSLSTADLREQINRLSMDEEAYFDWKKKELVQKGNDIKLVREHVAALKELSAVQKEAQKQQELARLIEKMEQQASGAPKPATGLSDKPVALSEEERMYARKLELAAGYYDGIKRYRDQEIEQLVALMEVKGEDAAQTAFNENLKAQAISAAANVAGQAYGLMINKLAQLAATGKLSAKVLIAAMMDITANTIIAIGQEAAVRAVMAYAKSVEAFAEFNPMAAVYAASASMYTKVAIGAAGMGIALKAGAMAMGGANKEAAPVYNANPYTGDPVGRGQRQEQKPGLTIVIEHAEIMGDDAMGNFAHRLSELVENYDVKLVASRTV